MQEAQEMWVQPLSWGAALEEEMATCSSILGLESAVDRGAHGLQSMGSQRVRHD